MHCLKCGKETAGSQVFCDGCLQTMEKYPVKPDAAIHLPRHSQEEVIKKPHHRKRALSPEEQLIHLKKLLRRMTACAVILLLLLCVATALLVRQLLTDNTPVQPMGRNYTIDTSQTD